MLLGLVLAIGAWSGLSVAWSVAPDLSWVEMNRTLVFAGFLGVGLLLGATGQTACRWAAAALVTALGAAVLWALAGKAIPALFADGGRAARLRDPIGYWNALALAADMLLVLALRLAAAPGSRMAARLGGAALAYSAIVAVFLAASRAGVAAAVLGVGLWLWLRRDRVEGALLAAVVSIPAAGVAAWAFTRPALVEDGRPHADRVADGAWFGLILVAGAALVALAVFAARPPPTRASGAPHGRPRSCRSRDRSSARRRSRAGRQRRPCRRRVPGRRGGERSHPFPQRELEQPARVVARGARDLRCRPSRGSGRQHLRGRAQALSRIGVGSVRATQCSAPVPGRHGACRARAFPRARRRRRAAALGAVRRLDGIERDAAAALAVALALWLVHALVDYDWDFVAVTGPALFAAGVLAAAGRPARRAPGLFAAAGAVALALAAIVSVGTPWLAERELRQVNVALDRGDLEAANDAVERARSLDPLSLQPVFADARVAEQRRREVAALEAYREATRLQPKNPESWLQLGLYEFDIGDRCGAYRDLNEAFTLDPAGKQWTRGGPLDLSLDWVNAGNCSQEGLAKYRLSRRAALLAPRPRPQSRR